MDLNNSIKLNSESEQALILSAELKSKIGDKMGSISDFTNVVRFNPKNGFAFYNRGILNLNSTYSPAL